jgi:ABC-type lipoprotein release transport system permease subunit
VTIETSAGREHTLRVAGRVHDAGQAQARMENIVYGYIAPETLTVLGEAPTLDRLYVRVGGDALDEANVRRVAGNVGAWLEANGHPVERVDVPPPGRHPHADIMGLLLLVMAAFGFLALVLSGVIVVNLLLAMMAAERRQIGVMKAVGGSRAQIAGIYLAEAGLFGVVAFALAMPAGVFGGRALSRYFAVLLNFDLASLAAPAWIYLLVAVVALLVPLAAAAYPVAAGTAITVHEAIAATGVNAATFGANRLDRLLSGVGGVWRPLLLGVRNSARRRTRTGLTLITFTVAGAFYIGALSVRTSMLASVDRRFGARTYGADFRYAFDQHVLMFYVFLIIVSAVLAAVGGLGLMTATSLNVLDRRRELGVLRAIGASPAIVCGIVVLEATFIALVAWAMAIVGAWPITYIVSHFMAALFRDGVVVALSSSGIAGWLGISMLVSVAASVVPALAASRRSIHEAISCE